MNSFPRLGKTGLILATVLVYAMALALWGCSTSEPMAVEPGQPAFDAGRYASHTEVVCSGGVACATYSVALELYSDGRCFADVAVAGYPTGAWVSFESDYCTFYINEQDQRIIVTAHGIAYGQGDLENGPREYDYLWSPVLAYEPDWSGLWYAPRIDEPAILLERVH